MSWLPKSSYPMNAQMLLCGRRSGSFLTGFRDNRIGSVFFSSKDVEKNSATTTPVIKRELRRFKLKDSGEADTRAAATSEKKPSVAAAAASLRIYTRTGDGGRSSLFTGERRHKDDDAFQALGAIDELSSYVGLAMEFARQNKHPYVDNLERIQCLLQDIGSALATPFSSAREVHTRRVSFNNRHTKDLEEWIDEYSDDLPPLENFILPGGGIVSSSLHVCRSICRRAERAIAPLVRDEEVDPEILKYVNRLSDLLFTMARTAAKIDKREETIYIRPDWKDQKDVTYTSGADGLWKKTTKK